MGLDFTRATASASVQTIQEPTNELQVVEYDIVADRNELNTKLVNSPEVDAIVSTIEVYNLESIVSFGSQAAEEISKASDVVLNSMNVSQLDDSSQMLNTLAKIMDKFDIEEIKENKVFFGKLFGNAKKTVG